MTEDARKLKDRAREVDSWMREIAGSDAMIDATWYLEDMAKNIHETWRYHLGEQTLESYQSFMDVLTMAERTVKRLSNVISSHPPIDRKDAPPNDIVRRNRIADAIYGISKQHDRIKDAMGRIQDLCKDDEQATDWTIRAVEVFNCDRTIQDVLSAINTNDWR